MFTVSSVIAAEPERLEIHTAEQTLIFQVELARTPDERARGLMFRRSMAPDHGMLFDFRRDQHVGMWMKNTIIPLDMLFISAQGEIRKIVKRTVPKSLAPISSGEPVRAVLELNGGTTDRLKIKPGDKVSHSMFPESGD
jgi:uncharacterized membrane protein (UPF0127 family)